MPVPRSEPVEGLVEAEGCLHLARSCIDLFSIVLKGVFLDAVFAPACD